VSCVSGSRMYSTRASNPRLEWFHTPTHFIQRNIYF
jgi:hypothetical protein